LLNTNFGRGNDALTIQSKTDKTDKHYKKKMVKLTYFNIAYNHNMAVWHHNTNSSQK